MNNSYSLSYSLEYKLRYDSLTGDPCYKPSRFAKERFFRNPYCSFLFAAGFNQVKSQVLEKIALSRKEDMDKVLEELSNLAWTTLAKHSNLL